MMWAAYNCNLQHCDVQGDAACLYPTVKRETRCRTASTAAQPPQTPPPTLCTAPAHHLFLEWERSRGHRESVTVLKTTKLRAHFSNLWSSVQAPSLTQRTVLKRTEHEAVKRADMWEPGAAASKAKRGWTKLSRPHFSLTPSSPTWGGDSEAVTPSNPSTSNSARLHRDGALSEDSSFLQTLRKLLSDFDQLHTINGTPLSDHRVVTIRKEIERGMPRVYSLAGDKVSNHSSTDAGRVKIIAEDFLRKFPDVNIDDLRPKDTADTASKPKQNTGAEHTAYAQGSTPTVTEKQRPVESSWNSRRPSRNREQTEGVDDGVPSSQSRKALSEITPEQKTMLAAVHEMLGSQSASIFEPPAALSPEEVQMGLPSPGEIRSFVGRSQEIHPGPHSLPPRPPPGQNVR